MRKLIYFALILIIIFFIFYKLSEFKISGIECKSQYYRCSDAILSDLDLNLSNNPLEIEKEIKSKLSENPLVKRYSLSLKLNGEIMVKVEERSKKYCVRSNDKTFNADSSGIIIEITAVPDQKCLNENDISYVLKDRLNAKDLFSQGLYYKLRNIKDVGSSYFEGNNLVIEYKGAVKLIFPLEGDPVLLSGKVYYTVSQFDTIEENIIKNGGSKITELDFRYNNPVVRYI